MESIAINYDFRGESNLKDSKAMQEANHYFEKSVGISMRKFDSLYEYTTALIAQANIEALNEMVETIIYPPVLEIIKNELKKRGELS